MIFRKVLSFTTDLVQKRMIHASFPNWLKLTDSLNAEPPKAKKRVDPMLVKAKEERKRRKIEKEIKKLEKFGRKLKPIEELRPDRQILKELDQRKRNNAKISDEDEVSYNNQNLEVEWTKYKNKQYKDQTEQIKTMIQSQKKALSELNKDNFKLYEMAIQLDESLAGFKWEGPSYTPSIKNYEPPEGDYIDNTYLYDKK